MVQGSWFKVQGVQEPKAELVERIELSPNGQVVALNIPAGQWHTVRALESGSVILEMKEGAYEPTGPEDILIL
jgi:cupin fold WbuC family metalloprotein